MIKMLCLGITASKKKCTNKVRIGQYCRFHQNQQNNHQNKKNNQPINYHAEEHQIGKDPCSICLCDVDEKDDCHLICLHKHHTDCIKQMIIDFCPVCRGPLTFKTNQSKIIDQIKEKSVKEKMNNIKEQIQSDITVAQELHHQDLHQDLDQNYQDH